MLDIDFYLPAAHINILLFIVLQAPEFPEFSSEVQEAINLLGGRVFPKLNWSAPRVSRTLSRA